MASKMFYPLSSIVALVVHLVSLSQCRGLPRDGRLAVVSHARELLAGRHFAVFLRLLTLLFKAVVVAALTSHLRTNN